MVTLVVVVPNEGCDVRFKITGKEVIFKQDAVLERLMPAFDFTLCLRMIWRAARVRHAFVFQILGQITGDVTGPIIRRAGHRPNRRAVAPSGDTHAGQAVRRAPPGGPRLLTEPLTTSGGLRECVEHQLGRRG